MKRSASLILMELVIMLLVFSLAAALCLQAFVWADSQSRKSSSEDSALIRIQNAAEVLCLTVFALLSVSTVQAQLRLAQSVRSAAVGYYSADCAAEKILSQLRAGICPEGVERKGDEYTYTCAVSETQVLAVCVKVNGADYTILRWQTVSTADWEAEDKLPVWNGQEP